MTSHNPVVPSAPPPLHTLALVGLLLSTSIYYFPSIESIDAIATPATFANVIFPEFLSVHQVGYIRLTFALIIALDCLYAFFYGE
jgi:hypothetical protein